MRGFFLILVLGLFCAANIAHSESIRWVKKTVQFKVVGKSVQDTLRDFLASQNVPAHIDDDVTGIVTGDFDTTPQLFLNSLTETFGFIWYYDGAMLYISGPNSMQATTVHLSNFDKTNLNDALKNVGLLDTRFPIRFDALSGVAIVTGPPRYIQIVQDVVKRLENNVRIANDPVVRIFPLQHAWAMDRSINLDGSTVNVPGVASQLNQIFKGQAAPQASATKQQKGASNVTSLTPMSNVTGGSNNGVIPPLPSTSGAGMSSILGGSSTTSSSTATPLSASGASADGVLTTLQTDDSEEESRKNLPMIVADQRTNSVIIRDLPSHMAQYQPVIDHFDVRPQLIEIDAHIINVDTTALNELGVDWTLHNSHIDFQTGNGTDTQNTFTGNVSQTFSSTTSSSTSTTTSLVPSGGSLAAVIGNSARYVMARIYALESTNDAHEEASPQVLTTNNVEAVMDRKTQFYVSVSGYASTDLYSVSSGISLRVLPMVVGEEDGKQRIKLDVEIEDGKVSTSTINTYPVTTTSTITTQAYIEPGQSLLIAGYHDDTNTIGTVGIPFLSKIPLIGGLFRYKSKQNEHVETLYMLTPRLVEY